MALCETSSALIPVGKDAALQRCLQPALLLNLIVPRREWNSTQQPQVCTEAVLGAVQEEAAVVQLAQQLVGAEAVAVEAQAAKAKAQEAAAAVAAVEAAAARLNQAQADANSTLSRLQQAAATLERVANRTTGSGTSSSTAGSSTTGGSTGSSSGGASTGKGSGSTSGTGSGSGSGKGSGKEGGGGGSSSSGVGGIAAGITSWVEERKQAAQDTKELKGVEAQLKVVRSQVSGVVCDFVLCQLAQDQHIHLGHAVGRHQQLTLPLNSPMHSHMFCCLRRA